MYDIVKCKKCHKTILWNEFAINFGWCEDCFNESYTEYMESVAGPFDWIAEGANA